jgi:hypothetical protein
MSAICKLPLAGALIAVTIGALLLFGSAPILATEQATEAQTVGERKFYLGASPRAPVANASVAAADKAVL